MLGVRAVYLCIQAVKQGVSRINLLLFKEFVQCMQEYICVCLRNQSVK